MKKISGLLIISWLLLGAVTDPTRPPDFHDASNDPNTSQQLSLSAIFVYPTHQIAIINGLALKVGDHIGEYTITTINLNTVELLGPRDTAQTLELVSATVKKLSQ